MEMPVRPTTLASQCYPPSSDFMLDHRHVLSAPRPPLRESTGNAQYNHYQQQHEEQQRRQQQQQQQQQLGALVRSTFTHHQLSIPSPPVIPTQSLSSAFGSPEFLRHQQRQQMQLQRRQRGINPIYLSPQFLSYREKQAKKSKEEKADQIWPEVLEDAFLDALLLIPQQMGKRKYTMRSQLWGRNMLILEFLWIAYCASLPPGTEPDPKMRRTRKQVSSHIQVLKNFFLNHRCFHFFFPRQENKEEKNRQRKACKKKPLSASELKEIESFKKNPVLIALAEGRLPDERPNYEYFAQILALNDQICIRPKRCWIFVSHPNVTVRGDGAGYLPTTGDRLDKSEYPHLERNLEKEKWPKEEQQIFKGSLLHEFTKEIRQVESSTVREVSRGWETSFPELHERLETIIAADSRCDYLHMNVALELKEKRGFPNQSDFNSWIEVNIEQQHLLTHRWKVETKLVRPAELSFVSENSPPQTYYETEAEIAIQYQHIAGCDRARNSEHDHHCNCISAQRPRDWVMVPFPADAWARTLTNAAEYPAHPFTKGTKRMAAAAAAAAASLKREDDSSDDDGDDTESTSTRSSIIRGEGEQPTQMELVPQIAMLQEIWSCPPESSSPLEQHQHDGTHRQQQWTRRAVILWTFETIHSLDRDGKLITAQTGKTSWRFLTVLDPTSPYHKQKALLSSSDAAAAGQVITPNRHAANGRAGLSINPHFPGGGGMGAAATAATDAFIPSPISSSMGTTPAGMGGGVMTPASGYHHHLQNAAAVGLNSDLYNPSAAATSTSWADNRGSFSSVGSGATHLSSAAATGYNDAHFQMMLEQSMRAGGGGSSGGQQRLGSSAISVHSGLETPPPSATMSNGNSFNAQNFDGSHQHPAAHHHTGLSHHAHSAGHHHAHTAHHPPQPSLSDLAAVTDPFLTAAAAYGAASSTNTAPSTWSAATAATGGSGLDPTWPATASTDYGTVTASMGARTSHLHPQTAAVTHHGSNPVSRAGSVDGRYGHQYHQQQHQPSHHQQQQQWQGSHTVGPAGLVDDHEDLWTPATSTGPEVHWPGVSVDEQSQSQSHSQPQQSQQNQYARHHSQDQYHQSQSSHHHHQPPHRSPEEHLSQEWDEMVASVNGSQSQALEEVHLGDNYQPQALMAPAPRGVKRTRSVADLGATDDEDDEHNDGGVRDNNDGDYEE
ncbi:putative regulatory protein abaA [Sordaria brevicollis]|uniref:Regulatory protein abaA n=1 Tax=Sordaria brevicollis TaxID=83679 RepID=A0AAE0PAM9_SORBR|nr:putative regulatory protein abaA [Sordaria brevicollis]